MSKDIFEGGSNASLHSQLSLENAWRGPDRFDTDANFAEKALGGFVDSAREAWSKPGETALTVGSGLAIGAVIQTGLNNAEHMGGKIGLAAKVGKTVLIGVPAVLTANRLLNADDGAYESGKLAFEMGLFLGAAKAGSYADRIPGVSKYIGPRATTDVPDNFSFRVIGNNVRVRPDQDIMYPMQVRLTNGKGFVVDNRWDKTVKLNEMPLATRDGALEYTRHTTTLVNQTGRYERNLLNGSVSTERGGQTLMTGDGKNFRLHRNEGPLGREEVSFGEGGGINVLQGSYQSGRSWDFMTDGSISMRSLPAGKYRINITPDGTGSYTYTHGTSRGIMGMVGPRSRHAPLVRDTTPVSTKAPAGSNEQLPFPIPDVTRPDPYFMQNLTRAREVLNDVAPKLPK